MLCWHNCVHCCFNGVSIPRSKLHIEPYNTWPDFLTCNVRRFRSTNLVCARFFASVREQYSMGLDVFLLERSRKQRRRIPKEDNIQYYGEANKLKRKIRILFGDNEESAIIKNVAFNRTLVCCFCAEFLWLHNAKFYLKKGNLRACKVNEFLSRRGELFPNRGKTARQFC